MSKTQSVKKLNKNLNSYPGAAGKLSMNSSSSVVLRKIIGISGLPITFLAEKVFEVTPKTLTKYRDHNTKFPALLMEHSLKFLEMYKTGLELFGNKDEFNSWLSKPSLGLGFEIPLNLMNTYRGVERIFEELKRIEYGATA
jgi:putative toxin-antitoxin system antitoxin component (TIGR02293 family)